jgi:hypothetical protein
VTPRRIGTERIPSAGCPERNPDGSLDLYIGPKPPKGEEANWIPTMAGKGWFPVFRFYGPDEPLFRKTWKLPDIEKVK